MPDGFVQLTVRVPPKMRLWLERKANEDMTNISIIVRQALKQFLERQKGERGQDRQIEGIGGSIP